MDDRHPEGGTSRAGRLIYRLAGSALVAVGILGAFLPLLPSTIFFIGATACFARSSPALEAWLVEHPLFGPGILAWREERAIRPRAKLAALTGMAVGYAFFHYSVRPDLPLALLVAIVLLGCAAYVATRPSGRDAAGG
jgi:hypothetical protein